MINLFPERRVSVELMREVLLVQLQLPRDMALLREEAGQTEIIVTGEDGQHPIDWDDPDISASFIR